VGADRRWPDDPAGPDTPVAANAAEVADLAAGAVTLGELVARQSVCRACPRLVAWREEVAVVRRRSFRDELYWGRPIPGWGSARPRLLIVGLAPAAHGGNRTGRIFTGDRSGDFLYKCLYKMGFANQPVSRSIDDGLKLNGAYVTAAVKCAPPDNKPSPVETSNCSSYLGDEIDALPRLSAILCLGQFAFNAVMKTIRKKYKIGQKTLGFAHGRILGLAEGVPLIVCSYHPSPRNTQTGKLTEKMFLSVLRKLSELNTKSAI